VLTDLVMPEKPGTVMAEDLLRRRPETQVMFMSGYVERVNRLPSDASFIAKPFMAEALVEQVERTLATKERA
jgi:FixJ family two-component response regulator